VCCSNSRLRLLGSAAPRLAQARGCSPFANQYTLPLGNAPAMRGTSGTCDARSRFCADFEDPLLLCCRVSVSAHIDPWHGWRLVDLCWL